MIASYGLDYASVRNSKPDPYVGRIGYGVTCDGDVFLHDRRALDNSIIDSCKSRHVVNDTARVSREHLGVDLASRNGVDELTLASLRVLGAHYDYAYVLLSLNKMSDLIDGRLLVVLYRDYTLRVREQGEDNLHSAYHALRFLYHEPVVVGKHRLTL